MSFPARITGVKSNQTERRNSTVSTRKVPNAKKPRSRPPKGIRDRIGFLHGHLPYYSGPYSVGSMDIEVPVDNPRTFSDITRHGRHLLKMETVLFTMYYPSAFGSGAGVDPAGKKNWSRETWLPRPRMETAKGYGKFAGIPGSLAVSWFAGTTMFTKLPAFRNPPPAMHWPPAGNSKHQGYSIKNQSGPAPPDKPEEPVFPVLIFSHGLGGTRTAYSSMCGEFASYGFVVCALEHRDGSGPRTFVNHAKEGEGSMKEREERGHIDHTDEELKNGYDTVDYIFPKDNPIDTSPLNDKGVDRELRNAQTELRMAEIEEALRVLRQIQGGHGEEVARKNLRREGHIGSSSRGLDGVDWSAWKDRFHCERVTMAGHSFGAATTVEILRNADRFKEVQAGIIYDIWGAPIKPPKDDARHRIHAPLLGINSEAFMYWQSNFDAVSSLMKEADEQGAPAYLCTVRGSVHVSQSDFSILYPHVCEIFLKSTVNPERAIDLNVSVSLEFLRDVTKGAGKSIIERCLTDEELLKTAVVDEMPQEHRPSDKWIGGRLKIPHEFRTRLLSHAERKVKRNLRGGKSSPGDELWMHFKPEEDAVAEWRRRIFGDGKPRDGNEHLTKEKVAGKADSEQKSDTEAETNQDDDEQGSYLGQPPSWQTAASE